MKQFRFFLFSAMILIVATKLCAIPAIPFPVVFSQPNGDTLTVLIKGDERIHWHESIDGYTLLFNQSGYLSFARLDEVGNLQPSEFVAASIEKRDAALLNFLNTIEKRMLYSDIQRQLILQIWEIEDEYEKRGDRGVIGQYKTICAFVQFPEKSMTLSMSQFENLMNQLGYTGNGTGSVRDFFKESSYNQFDLLVTLCGVYTAPNSESYYAGNDGTQYCQALAKWAAQQVAAEPNINFADYDSNNDGKVDGFHFIFAGRGQEAGGGSGTIWSHKWQFSPAVCKNGKCISIYSCSPELYNSQITTIGVICHEMTHAFGAPDFYDTNGASGGQYEGTGNWDVMAGGSWNGNPGGNRPPHHNMYTKWQFGWVVPTVLSSPSTVTNMPNSAENPVAYRINTGNGNEHYLLENRQRIKFDTNVPGDGLIIYHVYSSVGTSEINATHPQRMYPVCASSSVAIPVAGASNYGNINSNGCTFPGSSNKTAFNGTSTPRMFHWTNTVINDKPITNITHSNRFISFDFMGGGPTPMIPVTSISNVPSSAFVDISLPLSGTVIPNNATNQTISWSIMNPGLTGASISGNNFIATAEGAAVVTATISDGIAVGAPYTEDFTIIVNKPALAGSVSIFGIATYGETLIAEISELSSVPAIQNLGAISYQWKRNNTNVGSNNNTYTLGINDIGAKISVSITTLNCNGIITSINTDEVSKASQERPEPPTLLNATSLSITLNSIPNCEYRRDGGNWQESSTFSNLFPATTYCFEARKKETTTHLASEPSQPACFTTNNLPVFTITASVNNPDFGTINPEGETLVEIGSEQSYTISANTHYHIIEVLVNDENVEEAVITGFYTFTDINADQTIRAVFEPDTYTVTFMANGGDGNMNPQEFIYGKEQNLSPNIFSKEGYNFAEWNTDAAGTGFSFLDEQYISIDDNFLLFAQWEMVPPVEYTITATATNGGEISPSGKVIVLEGASQKFTITPFIIPEGGYIILDVLVDGVSVGADGEYVFEGVNSNHTIHAVFDYVGISEFSAENNSIQIAPNPTSGELRITNYQLRVTGVEVYDVYGRNLLSSTANHTPQTLDISHLPAGVYFVQVITDEGIITKKVVKM